MSAVKAAPVDWMDLLHGDGRQPLRSRHQGRPLLPAEPELVVVHREVGGDLLGLGQRGAVPGVGVADVGADHQAGGADVSGDGRHEGHRRRGVLRIGVLRQRPVGAVRRREVDVIQLDAVEPVTPGSGDDVGGERLLV